MWVIVALSSLAAIVIFALCLPIDIALQADVHRKPRLRLKLSWFFGLVSKEVIGGKKRGEKKAVKEKPRRRKVRIGLLLDILRTKGLLRQLKGLALNVIGRFKIRDLTADFRVGLDNPADTGLLFAFIGPATALLNSSLPLQINAQPSFEGEAIFEGRSQGTVGLRPIQLVIPFLRFIFSLTMIRVLRKLALTRWKRKK